MRCAKKFTERTVTDSPEGHPKRRPDPGKKAGSPARDATDFSGRKLSGLDPSDLEVDGLEFSTPKVSGLELSGLEFRDSI